MKRPPGVNVIRGMWLFKKKHTVKGLVSNFKARFVAMGNTQREGMDYGYVGFQCLKIVSVLLVNLLS